MQEDSKLQIFAYKLASLLPDKLYLSLKYYKTFGRFPNWSHPKSFTEKIQWLKIYNRKPEFTTMVDKFEAKKYVANIIGEEYVIPTLGVWDHAEDIDFNLLPNQFVLKATHDSGRVIICKDKTNFDRSLAIKDMRNSLKRNFYSVTREWPYKNVKRRIIAEKFITMPNIDNNSSDGLLDYKFFCFNGRVCFFKVDFGRFIEHHANYYTPNGQILPFGEKGLEPDFKHPIILPNNLKEMINIAERLAFGQTFLRVDLYNVNGQIYFGELTFYPGSGLVPYTPPEWDEKIGDLLKL